LVTVESALVDRGATFTAIPRALADRLQLEILETHQAQSAAGPISVDESFAYFDYDGHRTVTPVWISDHYEGLLIGVVTLESLGVAVHPRSGQLIESDRLLL
jgi:predicted aspartyl protease